VKVTLSDGTLIRTEDGARSEQQLCGDDEVLAAYRVHFGIELDRAPAPRRPPG
jgi:N-hydroxyarylamine O-acetyltransferase